MPRSLKHLSAEKLYKQGWRDSPDPKILFKGIRGKCYKLIIFYQKFKSWCIENPNTSIPLVVGAFFSALAIGVTLFIFFSPNTSSQTKNETKTQTKSE